MIPEWLLQVFVVAFIVTLAYAIVRWWNSVDRNHPHDSL